MCHAGIKSARPSIDPSPEPRWGLTLIEPRHPYYLSLSRRSRSDGRKLSIPSNAHIPAARRGKPLIKLTGRSGHSFHHVWANSIAT